jgi:HSP20 family protein
VDGFREYDPYIKYYPHLKGGSIMQLTKWDPLREMEDIFDRYNRALSWPRRGSKDIMATEDWAPRVDIVETDNDFNIKAEIPEVKKEDVKVSVDNGVLTIKGERKQEKEEKNKKFHRIERSYGSFARSFVLPENVDANKIDASFKDGMLNLSIPKTKEVKPKAIDVKIK